MWRVIITAALILTRVSLAAAELPPAPRFSDYPTPLMFKGHVASIDISSDPDVRRFRTQLRDGAKNGPNFADHFTIVTWGCGTNCNIIAVVNAETGTVIFPGGFNVDISFRRDSRLVILNPPEVIAESWQFPKDCDQPDIPKTTYLEWTGKEFRTILVSYPCAAWKKQ